jgi:hypothetical protein
MVQVSKSFSDQGLDLSGVLLDCDTTPGRWVPAFRVNMLPDIQVPFVIQFMVNMQFRSFFTMPQERDAGSYQVHSHAEKSVGGFFLSPEPEVT